MPPLSRQVTRNPWHALRPVTRFVGFDASDASSSALSSFGLNRPVLSRPLTRMQQHVLDDRIGALAVLYDLVEIALQRVGDLADLGA